MAGENLSTGEAQPENVSIEENVVETKAAVQII
jgi:hypothetical protein